MAERQRFDVAGYVESIRTGPCFICGLVSGDLKFAHHIVFEDDFAIAFLNKFPPLAGYVLVCLFGLVAFGIAAERITRRYAGS